MNFTQQEQDAERADVQSRAQQLVELGYTGKGQELVDQFNHKYKLGQYTDPSTIKQLQSQPEEPVNPVLKRIYAEYYEDQNQHLEPQINNQPQSEQILRRIYTEYYDDLEQKNQIQKQIEPLRREREQNDQVKNSFENLPTSLQNYNFDQELGRMQSQNAQRQPQRWAPDPMTGLTDGRYRFDPSISYQDKTAIMERMNRNAPVVTDSYFGKPMNIRLDPNLRTTGGYDAKNNVMIFQSPNITDDTIHEEAFHAYQDRFYDGGIGQYHGKNGEASVELEAKIYKDLMHYKMLEGFAGTRTVDESDAQAYKNYEKWMDEITSDYAPNHPLDSVKLYNRYNEMLKYFQQYAPKAGYDPSTTPNVTLDALWNALKDQNK